MSLTLAHLSCLFCFCIKSVETMPRKCKNSPDLFCFVCGDFNPRLSSRKFSPRLLVAYYSYFRFGAEESLSKPWSQGFLCSICSRYLTGSLKGTHTSLPFTMPALWREQQNHVNDCYFIAET